MRTFNCMECNTITTTNEHTDHCSLCRPHMLPKQPSHKEASMRALTSFDIELLKELANLGYASGSMASICNDNLSAIQALSVEEDDNASYFGFNIAKGEAMQKEEEFSTDIHFAKAYVQNNPRVLQGLTMEDLSDELLVEIVNQYIDKSGTTGRATVIPTVTIRFEKYSEKYGRFIGMMRGSWGFNFQGHSNFVMTTRDGAVAKKANVHQIERDLEDVFIMEEGRPVGLRMDSIKVNTIKMIDGKATKVTIDKAMDCISAYAAAFGISLDGDKHRAVISCNELNTWIGFNTTEDRVLVDIVPGVVAVQPKDDADRDSLLSQKESSELKYRAVSDTSYVSYGKAEAKARSAALADERTATEFGKRKAAGELAKRNRIIAHAEKVVAENEAIVELIGCMTEYDAECCENPKEILKVAKALKTLGLPALEKGVYRALTSIKKETIGVQAHEIISLINDSRTLNDALRQLRGNMDLIEEVLETAESNLKQFNADKKSHNVDKAEYNLLPYGVYKELKDIKKNFAA